MQTKARVNRTWLIAGLLSAAVLVVCLTARHAALAQAPAEPAAPATSGVTKIAVANMARIFAEMQETKELKTRMDAEGRALVQQDTERANKLKELQSARDMTKTNTPQWEKAQKDLTEGRIQYRVWAETIRADLDRRHKQQTRELFDEIVAAISEIAKQRGIDLVVAERRQLTSENVEKMSVDDFNNLLSQREVLFASAQSDISSDVIALLDAKFKEKK